jgi:hypothetical protein
VTSPYRIVAIALLLHTPAHAAEHDWPVPPRAAEVDERVSLGLSSRAGLVTAPFVTTAFPEVSGFAAVLTGSAAVHTPPLGWLRLRVPLGVVRLDFPAGAQVAETVLGNLELSLEHQLELRPATRWGLVAALVAPSAPHGPEASLLANRALALCSALNGGADSLLLTPGIMGLRVGSSVEQLRPPFAFRASLDVPVLVRVSDASLPDETETRALGIVPAIDLSAAWWVSAWFAASLGGRLITEPLRVQEPTLERDRDQRLQFVLEPGLHARLGSHVAVALDASAPVGGALGGDAWSIAARGRLGF